MIEDFIEVCEDGVTRRGKVQTGKKDRKRFLRGYILGLVTENKVAIYLKNRGGSFFSFNISSL